MRGGGRSAAPLGCGPCSPPGPAVPASWLDRPSHQVSLSIIYKGCRTKTNIFVFRIRTVQIRVDPHQIGQNNPNKTNNQNKNPIIGICLNIKEVKYNGYLDRWQVEWQRTLAGFGSASGKLTIFVPRQLLRYYLFVENCNIFQNFELCFSCFFFFNPTVLFFYISQYPVLFKYRYRYFVLPSVKARQLIFLDSEGAEAACSITDINSVSFPHLEQRESNTCASENWLSWHSLTAPTGIWYLFVVLVRRHAAAGEPYGSAEPALELPTWPPHHQECAPAFTQFNPGLHVWNSLIRIRINIIMYRMQI